MESQGDSSADLDSESGCELMGLSQRHRQPDCRSHTDSQSQSETRGLFHHGLHRDSQMDLDGDLRG